MSEKIWGATSAEWEAFSALCKADIRPCVMNPNLMTLPTKDKPVSVPAGDVYSKRPSRVYSQGLVAGISAWQKMEAGDADLRIWTANTDLGCGFVGRTIKGIDIDVDDPVLSEEIDGVICGFFDDDLPVRCRPKSGRRMLLFRLSEPDTGRKKVSFKLAAGGALEFLFDRSFFVVAGTHKSGHRQYWPHGIPETLEDIPSISIEGLHAMIRSLQEDYGMSGIDAYDPTALAEEDIERDETQVDRSHPTYKFIVESDYFLDHLHDGKIAVRCPWADAHSSHDEDLTRTVVMPIGLGGKTSHVGFKCMHSEGHGEKTGAEFMDKLGYVPDDFPVVAEVTEVEMTRPAFIRQTPAGGVPPNEVNLALGLDWTQGIGMEIRFDDFQGDVMIRIDSEGHWRQFSDEDYTEICHALIGIGFTSVPENKLRAAVGYVAKKRRRDSALDWLKALRWDGRDRISALHRNVLGTEDAPYPQAVMNYMWTAMAGRVLSPGIKADMIPVLVGRQGVRKSSFVHALAPTEDWVVDIDLSGRDADTSRQLRGKVIAELAELRGLGTRDEDSIKAWVTKTHEEWVPKFKEFSTKYPRRFVMVGSINKARFLGDATGERRWLPLNVGKTIDSIDVEYVEENIEQLWAQAASMFMANGVMWQDAERLAKNEHGKFARRNLLAVTIGQWIHDTGKETFSTHEIADRCLRADLRSPQSAKIVYQIERAMISMGYEENEVGRWHLPFL